MKSTTSSIQCIIVSLIVCSVLNYIEAAPRCVFETDETPVSCPYGTAKNWCHQEVCAKGPGERCGGWRMKDGHCASGMYCSVCKRCTGCEIRTLKCYSGEFCHDSFNSSPFS